MLKCFKQSAWAPLLCKAKTTQAGRPSLLTPSCTRSLQHLCEGSVRPEPECLGPEGAFEVPWGPGKGLVRDSRSEGGGLGEQAGRHSLQLPSRLAAGCVP